MERECNEKCIRVTSTFQEFMTGAKFCILSNFLDTLYLSFIAGLLLLIRSKFCTIVKWKKFVQNNAWNFPTFDICFSYKHNLYVAKLNLEKICEESVAYGCVHKYEALSWPNVNISNFTKGFATILPKLQFQYLIFARYMIKGWIF